MTCLTSSVLPYLALRVEMYVRSAGGLRGPGAAVGLDHLNARIPNDSLQRGHEENAFLHAPSTVSPWDGLRSVRGKRIDEATGRQVTFAQARRAIAT